MVNGAGEQSSLCSSRPAPVGDVLGWDVCPYGRAEICLSVCSRTTMRGPVLRGDVTRQGCPSKGRRWKCCRVEPLHRGGLVPRMFVCRMPYCMLEEPCILNKYEHNAVVLLFSFFPSYCFNQIFELSSTI